MNKRFEQLATTLTAASVFALGASACNEPQTHESLVPHPSFTTGESMTHETGYLLHVAHRIAALQDSGFIGISSIPEDSKPAFTSGFKFQLPGSNTVSTVTEQQSDANDPKSVVAIEISQTENGVIIFIQNFIKTDKNTWNTYVSVQAKNGQLVNTNQLIGGESMLIRDIDTRKEKISHDPKEMSQAFDSLVSQVDLQLNAIALDRTV